MTRILCLLGLLLAFAAPAMAQTPSGEVVGETHRIPSTVMGSDREINVLLPASYGEGDRTYPVVYLLDGGQAQDFPHYAEVARALAAESRMQEVIFVGVASVDRQNELIWRTTDRQSVREWPNHGQSDRFRRFLVEEAKPWVQAHYRISGDDAVMGESIAGLFIVETFLRTPEAFDRYLAVSPSMWWDRASLGPQAAALLAAQTPAPRQLLLTIADEGGTMQGGVDQLVAALQAAPPEGLTWDYTPYPDLTHSTIFAVAGPDFLARAYPVSDPAQ